MPCTRNILTAALTLAATLAVAGQTQAQTPIHSQRPLSTSHPTPSPPDAVRGGATTRALGCLIQPHAMADIAASASGVIAQVTVDRGDAVKKGQVIAVLDHDVEQALLGAAAARAATRAEIATAQATRDMAAKKVERMRALTQLSYSARLDLEMAEGELNVAINQLQQTRDRYKVVNHDHKVAEQQLEQRYVRSPIDGVIADRLLNPGERVDGRAIARVITLDRLKVEVIAPADRFGKIRQGMTGTITPENASTPVTATVEQVDRFIDTASGTFRARMLLANGDLAIPAGVRCSVQFVDDGVPMASAGSMGGSPPPKR